MGNNINIELVVSSKTIHLNEVNQYNVGLKILNTNSQKAKFNISKTELWVNGEKNIAWDLAVQNGTLVNLVIPASASEKIMWKLGDALFPKAGNYKLDLRWKDTSQIKEVIVSD